MSALRFWAAMIGGLLLLFESAVSAGAVLAAEAPRRPNVVLIYADDIGYGDFSCYGATKVQTQHVDRLAREGLRFTDGHSASATCTPSRYAMLTGEYAWRKRGTGVLPGDAPLIIEPGRITLASILKQAGYRTGVVGKWHLGLGRGGLNWNGDIKPGPLELGFDYCFLMPATGDRVPCVYVENHRVVGLDPNDPLQVRFGMKIGDEPTGKENPELLKMHPSHGHDMTIVNGVSRIGYMTGGKSARWVDEDMADVFVAKAKAFVEQHVEAKKDDPFFLYFATHDIHVPRVPHSRFAGKSGLGPRGDALLQFDWCVGELLKTLDRLKLAENTLVILTSDNGPVIDDGYKDDAVAKLNGHKPSGTLRGGKYSNFEAGTRVPFLVRWPGRIKPGESDALVCQVDFPATFAELTGQKLQVATAPDSQNVLPALLGDSPRGRETLVEHAMVLSLRQGPWKLIDKGKGPKKSANTNTELGNHETPQLYNLAHDLGETTNVAEQHPDKVTELLALLNAERARGTAASQPRLNVLFLMADDLRTELASYGSMAKTPHLDRLTKRSVQFQRAYCQQAVCNPSRSSMLTGRRPDTLRLWNNGTHFRELNPDVTTLPLLFKENGYQSRCVGKIFHNWHTKEKGDVRSWSAPEFLHYATHADDLPQVNGELPPNHAKAPRCECRDVPDEAYFDGRVAAEAVRVLGEVKDKPFFLAVGFWKPHAPFNAPKRYWDLYDRAKLPPLNPSRPAGAPELAFHDGRELRGLPPNQVTFTPEQAAEIRHGYFANTSYMDAQLGKVLDALDQHGLTERTVIVFAGDHGYHLGEHSLWAKTSNFELDARVPLLIALPGNAASGSRCEALVELLDLFPTLVDLCQLPAPQGIEGTSLAHLLRDPAARGKPAAFTQQPRPAYFDREPSKTPQAMGCSVRTARVRYTEWRDWTTGEVVARELYDAVRDPAETRNVIDAPQLAEAQREAAMLLKQQFPVTPPQPATSP